MKMTWLGIERPEAERRESFQLPVKEGWSKSGLRSVCESRGRARRVRETVRERVRVAVREGEQFGSAFDVDLPLYVVESEGAPESGESEPRGHKSLRERFGTHWSRHGDESQTTLELAIREHEDHEHGDVLHIVEHLEAHERSGEPGDFGIELEFDPETGELTIQICHIGESVQLQDSTEEVQENFGCGQGEQERPGADRHVYQAVPEIFISKSGTGDERRGSQDRRRTDLAQRHPNVVTGQHRDDGALGNDIDDLLQTQTALQFLLDQTETRIITLSQCILALRDSIRQNPEFETKRLYCEELENQRDEAWEQKLYIVEQLAQVEHDLKRLRTQQLHGASLRKRPSGSAWTA